MVNMDETSVRFFHGGNKGHVVLGPGRVRNDALPTERATQVQLRGALTLVTFLCNRSDLQPLMPQVVICSKQLLSVRDLASIRPTLPRNVFVIRRSSGWVTSSTFVEIIKLFVEVKELCLDPGLQVIFCFDCCKSHLTSDAWDLLNRDGLHAFMIAAKMTWLLQPLDTHVFLVFKRAMKQLYQDLQMESGDANVSMPQLVHLICLAVRKVLQGRTWAHAFLQDGFGPDQGQVSGFILRQLDLDSPPPLSVEPLSDVELAAVLPSNVSVGNVRPHLLPMPPLPPPLAAPPNAGPSGSSGLVAAGPSTGGAASSSQNASAPGLAATGQRPAKRLRSKTSLADD